MSTESLLAELDLAAEGDPNWRERGYCRSWHPRGRFEAEQVEADPFFDPSAKGQRKAAELCREACPVMFECGKAALENDERYGVWGGMTERDREKLKKGARRA